MPGMHRSESFVVPEVSCEYQFPLKAPVRAGCVIMSEFSTAAYAGHLTWVLTGKGCVLDCQGASTVCGLLTRGTDVCFFFRT